jgi:Helicase conserved C-terminal domain
VTDLSNAAGIAPAAASTASGRPLTLAGWGGGLDAGQLERERLIAQARGSDAARQLQRCLPRWGKALEHLSWRSLRRLAANEPVDPNDRDAWRTADEHAQAVLRRHGITLNPRHLTLPAIQALVDGQARADRDAGLDWTRVAVPASALDERLRRAHGSLALDLSDPAVFGDVGAQRRALATRLGLPAGQGDDLSRWVLANPDEFDAGELRCWRIASPTWLAVAGEQLEAVDRVERPVALFVVPALRAEGWQLTPVLSLDAIRLLVSLGGRLERDLRSAALPGTAAGELVERINVRALHAGPKECLDSAGQLAQELTRELGVPVGPGVPRDKRDRWGRLLVSRRSYRGPDATKVAELELRVVTFPAREFSQRRLGAVRRDDRYGQPSAVMDLGEAVQTAVERGLPLLLSTEAAGHLKDSVRVGRMKGRPGALTITTSDGLSATTRRVVAEQATSELRALKHAGARVTLDAGARQLVRMTLARPLEDDPVLLGRQQEMAALKVVGSGVDASQTGCGKTITSGRALANRAATTRRLRAMIVAEGRLLGQWRDELTRGAPGRGLPPLAPNVEVLLVDERRPVAGQIRSFDGALGDRPGVALIANGTLDRYPADLQVIPWHLLIADEALRYANPATDAHQALKLVRFSAVADCWLLTATPRGKSAEHLDVLVGLAVGDEAMISERLNTREGGDLMDEIHAHRLRVNYGPHLVRVTRQDMQAWMPDVRPAQPLAIDPDPALAQLLDAIRKGGREAYRRLLAVLRELKTLEAGSELFKQALAELSRAQGVVLGNVGVYVDASVDPETLTHSQAALAKALVRQGLVAEATRGGGDGLPLLRGITAQTLAGVASEEQLIVFAERVWCLRQLARTLRERHGVEAHVADGAITGAEFEALKRRFTAGEFPVLCLSRIGAEGHNLQNSSCLCHLDLPWLPSGLEQRVGRAARPGAARGWVQTYIPYIRGAGVEHIVSILSPRGAEHHAVLDSFEGVAASQSTIATQLGAITGQVADAKQDAGYAATAARLRVAASVFGA